MPRVTIVIVTFNTKAEVGACLRSLAIHPPEAPHDVIVVDNASTDGTAEAIRAEWPKIRLIEPGRNLGFAAGNNLGIRSAAGEFVLLLNSDTIVPAGAVDALVGGLAARPDCTAAGPRIVDAEGRPELSFGRMIGPFNEARQKAIVRLQLRGFGPALRYVDRVTRRAGHPDWVSGACLLVRRTEALAAGLLDERFFLYAEDVDFCAALRARGGRILFEPAAEIVHLRGASRRTRPVETERAYRRSQLAFYEKHHPRWVPCLRAYLRMRGRLPPDLPS
ncbi:MAG TPA: glycosyltransferase family 2 protein [Vicinamibacterales bacterium]|nr:glycosyltransferase family 2 protein [Vicinamibacterales bacterium]HPW20771.1 glycosyltransferase family 2 protein [Vicinamibacterales bacterium]